MIDSLHNIGKVDDILAQSDSAKLSRFSISEVKLSQLMDQVYLARKDRQESPIFSGKSWKYYYQLPLAHSWAIEDSREVITLLHLLIAELNIRTKITILDRANQISSGCEMAIIDLSSNTYRYLSSSGFLRCTELEGRMICQKRKIAIKPRTGCSMQLENCSLGRHISSRYFKQ